MGPSAQLNLSLTPFYHIAPFMSTRALSWGPSFLAYAMFMLHDFLGHRVTVLFTLHNCATWSGVLRSVHLEFLIIRRHRLLYSKPTLCNKPQEMQVTQEMTRMEKSPPGCLPMTAAAAPGHRRSSRRPPCLLSSSVALFTSSSTIFSTLQIRFTQEPSPKAS